MCQGAARRHPLIGRRDRVYICSHIMYRIRIAERAREHLTHFRSFDRTRILDEIEAHLLSTPTVITARRKMLVGATPSFTHVQPVWQFQVGEFRVIYDVGEDDGVVIVRAVLRKGTRTTGEIL